MIKWPTISKSSLSFVKFLPELTTDDRFLIELNKIFSTSANQDGHTNQPRGYEFNQRLKFDKVESPAIIAHGDIHSIVESRAQEIVKRGRMTNIFWSGGIDSTLAVAAILPQLKHKDQVKIYHTCESIRENPYFIDYIHSFGVQTFMWSDEWVNDFNLKEMIVTGTSADEITGSLDRSFYDTYNSQLTSPWKSFFTMCGKSAEFIERCENLFAQCPVEIATVFDARWWFYFYIRHTNFARRDWDYNLEGDFSNNVQFFNCPAFDSWSMQNINNMVGAEYKTYKQDFKNAIYRYWKDDDFLLNKEKTNSFLSIQWINKKMALKNQHYLFIYKNASGKFKQFRPSQFPFVSVKDTMKSLEEIQGEI